jgi:hypothetical protein
MSDDIDKLVARFERELWQSDLAIIGTVTGGWIGVVLVVVMCSGS